MDRARPRATARLDHHRVVQGVEVGPAGRLGPGRPGLTMHTVIAGHGGHGGLTLPADLIVGAGRAGQDRRWGGQAKALEQEMGLVLVVGRAGDLRRGDERGQPAFGVGLGEHLDVEVGERQHRAHLVFRAEVFKCGHIAGVLDQRDRSANLRGVLRRGERRGVGDDGRRDLGEARDDVVALARTGQEY